MNSRKILTHGALGVTLLLPITGAFAASNTMNGGDTSATMLNASNTIMDAGLFRGDLHRIQNLIGQMQDQGMLAMATSDPLLQGDYTSRDRRLLERTLGVLDQVTRNWKHADMPAGAVAASSDRYGTADAQRYANESSDTAFVRNTVWDIQGSLLADKLNGRLPTITPQLLGEINAAVARADNPDFRVAQALDTSKLADIQWPEHTAFVWDRSHDMVAQAPVTPAPTTTTEETTTTTTAQAPAQPDQTQVAANPTPSPTPSTSETTTTDTEESRTGGASLPKTGGDPGLFFLFGGSFAGLGAFLRRRR